MNIQNVTVTDTAAETVKEYIEKMQNKANGETKKTTKSENLTQDEIVFSYIESDWNSNYKLSAIINKYNSGEELSAEELRYLEQNSPELAKEAKKMMAEREWLEKQMEKAETKSQAMLVAAQVMTTVVNGIDSPIVANQHLAQLENTIGEFIKTKEFKNKPELESELVKESSTAELIKSTENSDNDDNTETGEITETAIDSLMSETQQADFKNEENNISKTLENETAKIDNDYEQKQKEEKIKKYETEKRKNNIDVNV